MPTTITIEPSSFTAFYANPQKPISVSYSTTIPLEIPPQEAWEIVTDIIRICFPNKDVHLDAITGDLALDRYCFSATGRITPEALDVTVDV